MLNSMMRKLKAFVFEERFSDIFTGSLWALSSKSIAAGLALISSIFVARVYGADVVGTVALLKSLIVFIAIFTTLGINTSILRLLPEYINKYSTSAAYHIYRKSRYIIVATSLFSAILLLLFSAPIAGIFFSKPHLTYLFSIAFVFILVKSIMDLNTSAIRALRLTRYFALMQILPDLIKIIMLFTATYLFYNKDIPVYAMFSAWLITAIIGIAIIQYTFNLRIKTWDAMPVLASRDILSTSMPMMLTTLMSFIIGKSGVLILGIFRTEAEVGYYSIAVMLATLNAFILDAINSMAAPKFAELYHTGNISDLFYVAKKSTKLIFWTSVPILLSLICFGTPILRLIYGEDFTAAYPVLVLLTIGQFIHAVSGSTGMFMNMSGNQHQLRNIMIIAAFLNIFLCFLLIQPYGIIGTAIAAMASIAYWNIHALFFIKKKYGNTIGYFPFISRLNRLDP